MKTFTLGLMLGGFAHGQLQLSPQATKPDHAITAPPDFVGFEVESVFFDLFNNEFSRNMVNSLAARMSKPPVIRVGGTSGDYLVFNPQQSEDKVCIGSTCPANNDKYIIGPTFFKAYSNFPQARMTIQAPLNNPVNNTNTLDFVTRAWSQLENGKQVAAIALGNEPGFIYKSAQAYAVAAIELQQQIMSALNLTGSAARIFEAGNIATSAAADHTSYQVGSILKVGIDNTSWISSTAEHWYQIRTKMKYTDENLQRLIMNHTAIVHRFQSYKPALRASQDKDLPFVINEGAAFLGNGPPITYSGGFAYTLWAVDMSLALMARGVARVNNIAARPSKHRSFFTPSAARAPYPAAIYLADFISKLNSSITEIDTEDDLLSAYAMYDGALSSLQRVAIVNMRLFNGSIFKNYARPNQTFKMTVGPNAKFVQVKRLHADLGAAALGFDYGGPLHNVSWAGEQWSYAIDNGKGHLTDGQSPSENLTITNGSVEVSVPDSEAVILFMGNCSSHAESGGNCTDDTTQTAEASLERGSPDGLIFVSALLLGCLVTAF